MTLVFKPATRRRACPVATSTSHSSLAPLAASSRRNARWRWSGDQLKSASDNGEGNPAICRSLPSATDSSHSLLANEKRLAAKVFGWMRRPASFSSGWATSAMSGSAGSCSIAARSRLGESCSSGARGASTTACSALEGS
ncbi:hypothetical protein [Xanthomonas citri]|uniref:hypothetical protein n=1 Tax=Xanthomonas citri TaxID=346 RepID=UPI001F30162C|nr:hypothetical protein [Xanthomonas citri]